jgi:hypothetical protein
LTWAFFFVSKPQLKFRTLGLCEGNSEIKRKKKENENKKIIIFFFFQQTVHPPRGATIGKGPADKSSRSGKQSLSFYYYYFVLLSDLLADSRAGGSVLSIFFLNFFSKYPRQGSGLGSGRLVWGYLSFF